ncbi:TetR/AcrR family transcriptional regulator C-terminal domain-containing protein [Microbispora sp. NPDC049633]|uniref:TetR/AcrR family transcriptional regulator C-terminal domain-containing protein n=1 Tax=Microbispora sp. NPDC049633 TaxID=3154355 RepID=UPI00341D9AF0
MTDTGGTVEGRPVRPTLSHAYIVAVALALIDRAGLDKFSMRKLGAELGVDAMAVYRYFSDQEALFDGVAEALFDELDVDSLPWEASWRELTTETALRMRHALLRHPHAVTIFATRPVRSAAAISCGDRAVAVLCDAGFTPVLAVQAVRCVQEFTVGHVLALTAAQLGGLRRSRKPAPGSAGYNLLALGADGAGRGDHFETGLTALLDGFERLAR